MASISLEALGIRLAEPALAGHDLVHAFELRHAERRLQVGQSKVEAQLAVPEASLGLEGKIAQAAGARGERVVVGQQHAALAGRQQFVGVEAERARVAEAATAPTLVRCAVGLGGVLDDCQSVPLRHVEQGIHIHRVPIDVHGHDRPRALGDLTFDPVHVHRPRARIAVDQHGHGLGLNDRQRARDDGEGRHDDLVARLQIEQRHRYLQRHRAVGNRDAMPTPAVAGPAILESLDVRPSARDPTSLQGLRHKLQLTRPDPRLIDGDHGLEALLYGGARIGALLDLQQHEIVEGTEAVATVDGDDEIARAQLARLDEPTIGRVDVHFAPPLLDHQHLGGADDMALDGRMHVARDLGAGRVHDVSHLQVAVGWRQERRLVGHRTAADEIRQHDAVGRNRLDHATRSSASMRSSTALKARPKSRCRSKNSCER